MYKFIPVEIQALDNTSNALCAFAFSALKPFVGWQEEHPAHKNLTDEVLMWLSVWSEVKVKGKGRLLL